MYKNQIIKQKPKLLIKYLYKLKKSQYRKIFNLYFKKLSKIEIYNVLELHINKSFISKFKILSKIQINDILKSDIYKLSKLQLYNLLKKYIYKLSLPNHSKLLEIIDHELYVNQSDINIQKQDKQDDLIKQDKIDDLINSYTIDNLIIQDKYIFDDQQEQDNLDDIFDDQQEQDNLDDIFDDQQEQDNLDDIFDDQQEQDNLDDIYDLMKKYTINDLIEKNTVYNLQKKNNIYKKLNQYTLYDQLKQNILNDQLKQNMLNERIKHNILNDPLNQNKPNNSYQIKTNQITKILYIAVTISPNSKIGEEYNSIIKTITNQKVFDNSTSTIITPHISLLQINIPINSLLDIYLSNEHNLKLFIKEVSLLFKYYFKINDKNIYIQLYSDKNDYDIINDWFVRKYNNWLCTALHTKFLKHISLNLLNKIHNELNNHNFKNLINIKKNQLLLNISSQTSMPRFTNYLFKSTQNQDQLEMSIPSYYTLWNPCVSIITKSLYSEKFKNEIIKSNNYINLWQDTINKEIPNTPPIPHQLGSLKYIYGSYNSINFYTPL